MPVFSISGSVRDSTTREPLEYATFMLYRSQDSSQVSGIASKQDGSFQLDSLKPGRYFARVNFLGYEMKTLTDLALNREKQKLNVGEILLASSGLTTDEVVVEGERLSVEYHVEKKVINVAKQNIAPTGTAADILAQAPSVSVDIEGNVKLRGSSNFTVMIDGRPSILEANDALQQIPSGTIDKIEIITNPSSRFSAEGTAGIINIIPLRRGAKEVSGLINARTSVDERRGADFTFTRPLGKIGLTVGGNIGTNRDPGESTSETRTTFEDVATTVKSEGTYVGKRDNYGLRGEIDIPIRDNNNLIVGARTGHYSFGRTSNLPTWEFNDQSAATAYSLERSSMEHGGWHTSAFANWKHRFPEQDHTFAVDATYGGRDGSDNSNTEKFADTGALLSGIRSEESGLPSRRYEIKADYVRPFAENRKLEAGLSMQAGEFNSTNRTSLYDTAAGNYVEDSLFTNGTDFRRSLQAGYGMYSGEIKLFEYQVGLRGEYLDRKVGQAASDTSVALSRMDFYPSLHTATHLGGSKQLSFSYTRRVEHSRPWYLEPFLSWENSYSVRRGNPDLLPEFIDSYELGYQTKILGQFSSVEGFYRVKHNSVEMLRSVYAENVTLTMPDNVGTQRSLGTELRTDINLRKSWSLSLSSNLYDQRVNGDVQGRSFDEHTFTWDAKLTTIAALTRSTKFQMDGNYNGPTVTSQGDTEANFVANVGLRQDFLKKTLNVALQVRDVFSTGKRENTIETATLNSFESFVQDSPVFTLSIGYTFNNFKRNRQNARTDETNEDM